MPPAQQAEDYSDYFVALTEQRDKHTLSATLLASVSALLPNAKLWLLDYNDGHCHLLQRNTTADTPVPSSQILSRLSHAETSGDIRIVTDGQQHYLGFSILHSLSGILIIDYISHLPTVITKLLKTYRNQRYFMFSALNDSLTGLGNRQAFDQQMANLLLEQQHAHRRASDYKQIPWAFALLDIDHFKKVNDAYGHLFGDEVLLIFSQLMQQTFRDHDLLFRYGGEEFAIALQGIDQQNALKVLNRFRETVATAEFPQLGQVTVSIGVTQIEPGLSVPLLIDRADQALYYAKAQGRNQAHSFEALTGQGLINQESSIEGDIELF